MNTSANESRAPYLALATIPSLQPTIPRKQEIPPCISPKQKKQCAQQLPAVGEMYTGANLGMAGTAAA